MIRGVDAKPFIEMYFVASAAPALISSASESAVGAAELCAFSTGATDASEASRSTSAINKNNFIGRFVDAIRGALP
jgi:hypothetical protein